MDGSLCTGQKAIPIDELTKGISSPTITIPEGATLTIDGQALVMAMGKPPTAKTFGDHADIFVGLFFQFGSQYSHTDIVFDHLRFYKNLKYQNRN